MRRLEEHLWNGYLPEELNPQLKNILVYHWKSIAKPGESIGSFVALAKFRRLDHMFWWYVVGIVFLGAMGSSLSSMAYDWKPLSLITSWSGHSFAFCILGVMLLGVVLLARLRQPIGEQMNRIAGAFSFRHRSKE